MNAPRSILVLRFSSLGDVVLATSVAVTLKKAYPDCRLDFLTLTDYEALLENHPSIDRVIGFPRTARAASLRELGLRLRSDGYDYVIDLHNTLRAKIIRKYLRAIPTFVFKKPRLRRTILYYFHRNLFPGDYSQVRTWHRAIEPLVGAAVSLPLLSVSKEEQQAVPAELAGSHYVCLVPGAAWPLKQWLPERYAELAHSIVEEYHIKVVLLGTLHDVICDEIVKLSSYVVDLRTVAELRRTLSVIAGSIVTIGGDTGLVHAAEALGVPIVMLLGPTAVETGGGTNRADSAMIAEELYCRPCSQNGSRPCHRKEQYCMTQITVDKVKSAVTARLSK